jgi:hypothetical protein
VADLSGLLWDGGLYLSIAIVAAAVPTPILLPSFRPFRALCGRLARLPRAPALVVLGVCAAVLNANYLWTATGPGDPLVSVVARVCLYALHEDLLYVDYESLGLLLTGCFCILVLVSDDAPRVVVLKFVKYCSLLVWPWGLDILLFDRQELLVFTTSLQHNTHVFYWFTNLDLFLSSTATLAISSLAVMRAVSKPGS